MKTQFSCEPKTLQFKWINVFWSAPTRIQTCKAKLQHKSMKQFNAWNWETSNVDRKQKWGSFFLQCAWQALNLLWSLGEANLQLRRITNHSVFDGLVFGVVTQHKAKIQFDICQPTLFLSQEALAVAAYSPSTACSPSGVGTIQSSLLSHSVLWQPLCATLMHKIPAEKNCPSHTWRRQLQTHQIAQPSTDCTKPVQLGEHYFCWWQRGSHHRHQSPAQGSPARKEQFPQSHIQGCQTGCASAWKT